MTTDKQMGNSKRNPVVGRPWKKGQSGNPNGRPKKDASLTSLMKEMLDKPADYIAPGATPDDKTWRQVITKALFTKAAKGDVKAIELVLDRTEGKVPASFDGTGLVEGVPTFLLWMADGSRITAKDLAKRN